MNDDNHIGVCFVGSTNSLVDSTDCADFNDWLREVLYFLIDKEYCTRFIFRNIRGFEASCIRAILEALREDQIVKRIEFLEGNADFMLIVSEDGQIDQEIDAGKMKVDEIMTGSFKFPLTLSPYPVPGDERSKICEMIDLASYMVSSLSHDEPEDRFYLDYAKAHNIMCYNWRG